MVAEVVAALRVKPGRRYADGTVGGGGHAAAILAASAPNGWLSGFDRDGAALEAAEKRLGEFAGGVGVRRGRFSGVWGVVAGGEGGGGGAEVGGRLWGMYASER